MRSRQNVDLFEVLRRQSLRGRRSPGSDSRDAESRRSGESSEGPWAAVRGDLGRLWSGIGGMLRRGGAGGGRDGMSFGQPRDAGQPLVVSKLPVGLLLAVLGIGLAVGFALGSSTASAGGSALSTSRIEGVRQPGPSPELTRENELKRLTDFAFPVLSFSPSQFEDARRLASWLRQSGFSRARVYQSTKGSVVLVYVDGPDDTFAHGQLKALARPSFDVDWETVQATLNKHTSPVRLNRS